MNRTAERLFTNPLNSKAIQAQAPVMVDGSINWGAFSEANRQGRAGEFIDRLELEASVARTALEPNSVSGVGFFGNVRNHKAAAVLAALGIGLGGVGTAQNVFVDNDPASSPHVQNMDSNPAVIVNSNLVDPNIDDGHVPQIVAPVVVDKTVDASVGASEPLIIRSSELSDQEAVEVLDVAGNSAEDGLVDISVSVKEGNDGYDTRDWALARQINEVIDVNADPGALFSSKDPSINGALRWADFTAVAVSADGTGYAQGGSIHDGDKLQVRADSLAATFKAADLTLSKESIAKLAISNAQKRNAETALLQAEFSTLGINISGPESVVSGAASEPNTQENTLTAPTSFVESTQDGSGRYEPNKVLTGYYQVEKDGYTSSSYADGTDLLTISAKLEGETRSEEYTYLNVDAKKAENAGLKDSLKQSDTRIQVTHKDGKNYLVFNRDQRIVFLPLVDEEEDDTLLSRFNSWLFGDLEIKGRSVKGGRALLLTTILSGSFFLTDLMVRGRAHFLSEEESERRRRRLRELRQARLDLTE